MFRKNRFPDSLQWRAVGWMETGLSQADAARRLNVSRSVVQRLWNQFQTRDSTSRRSVPSRLRNTPAENRYLALLSQRKRITVVPQLVIYHFVASKRRISATTVPSLCRCAFKTTIFVCSFEQTAQKCSFTLGKGTCLLYQTTMGISTLQ